MNKKLISVRDVSWPSCSAAHIFYDESIRSIIDLKKKNISPYCACYHWRFINKLLKKKKRFHVCNDPVCYNFTLVILFRVGMKYRSCSPAVFRFAGFNQKPARLNRPYENVGDNNTSARILTVKTVLMYYI